MSNTCRGTKGRKSTETKVSAEGTRDMDLEGIFVEGRPFMTQDQIPSLGAKNYAQLLGREVRLVVAESILGR